MPARSTAYGVVTVLAMTLLAGCRAPPPVEATPLATIAPQPPSRPVAPRRLPSHGLLRATPSDIEKVGALPPPPPNAEALVRRHFAALGEPSLGDPITLKGRPADRILAILGDPDLVRRDAPAEMWQYAGEDCVLTLILYQKDAAMTVEHVETRDRARGTPVAGPACLTGILAERLQAS